MPSLINFVEIETLLQHMTKLIGAKFGMSVIVDRSSKCHQEIADKGIKYTLAYAKIYLRGVPLETRKNKGQFHDTIARDFIAAYHILDSDKRKQTSRNATVVSLSKMDIEKTRKRYRRHHGVE
eukprot:9947314-Ditylum_brightwellii.AAC.1